MKLGCWLSNDGKLLFPILLIVFSGRPSEVIKRVDRTTGLAAFVFNNNDLCACNRYGCEAQHL